MDLLYAVAEAIYNFMESSPGLLGTPVCVVVAGLPVMLLHELGHALAARILLGGEVQVTVGSAGKLAELQLGQIAVSLNALAYPGRAQGSAEFDASRAGARDVLLIALAGPAASLLGFVVALWAYSAAPDSGLLHDLLWGAIAAGLFGVLNLIPFTLHGKPGETPLRSDGRVALAAARVVRELS